MKLSYRNKAVDFSKPVVMGILNITPDSFSGVGRYLSANHALQHALQMVQDGVDIIDIGAEATNPHSHPITSLQIELDRLLPVLECLQKEIEVPISVDTSKPEVMCEAHKLGVSMINDIRALRYEGALETVAKLNIPVCLMHMACSEKKSAISITAQVKKFLQQRIQDCLKAGVQRENILIDPGIGAGNFGKSTEQSCELIQNLNEFKSLNVPILVGLSRKTFIGEILNVPENERLIGSVTAAAIAAIKGANIIRVHDVKATVQAMKIVASII